MPISINTASKIYGKDVHVFYTIVERRYLRENITSKLQLDLLYPRLNFAIV